MVQKSILLFIIVLVISIMPNACGLQNKNEEPVMPKVLHYGISTREEDPDVAFRRYEPLQKYIASELGTKVKVINTSGYSSIIEALKSHKIDFCSLGSFAYVIAHDRANAEVIACLGSTDGKLRGYYSIMITHKDSPIKSIEDIKKNASLYSIAYADPASTSGHLVPKSFLKSIGLQPGHSFKDEVFATSHGGVMLTTKSRKTDIGCCSLLSYRRMITQKRIDPDDFRVLWQSEPIIRNAICVREGLHPDVKAKIQKAFLNFRFDEPKGWDVYASRMKMYSFIPVDSLTYVAVHDSMYNPLREISNEFKIYETN